jgi:class 3 adenylate cyclase
MKRLTYISKASEQLTLAEIEQIGEISTRNNQRDEITGVLLYLNGFFFQIIEGKEKTLDDLYTKILVDNRHTDILCLKTEYHITERHFPNWAMRTINLDQYSDILIQPVKTLLQTVTESHRVLEKYTQPSVFRIIHNGINPLTVSPQLVERIIFFSDILAFSTFTEKLPVAEVVKLVNYYFTLCTQIITEHGGEVMKFIGDCVMASFTPQQADAAISASLNILTALEQKREQAATNDPLRLLHTGIGLSSGEVIEGNFGSMVKMDYTLLGDAVNVASRLEALTRHLPYSLAFTHEVKQRCQNPWSFINLGKHHAKGKQQPIEVYSINETIAQKANDTKQTTQWIIQSLDEINRQT